MIDIPPFGYMGRTAHLSRPWVVPPMTAILFVNPRSGSSAPSAAELRAEAEHSGVGVHELGPDDDLVALAREADAEVLGMAGGDGSLGAVASVAIERDLPFVCIPFGTRNHFARDAGLDRDDPMAALAAFANGVERRVDVGRVGDRLFLNNVSLGLYARLVHRRERHRRRRDALAKLRAFALVARDHHGAQQFEIDGETVRTRVVLVACNAYSLGPFSIGEREELDGGQLHLYVSHGLIRREWRDRSAAELTIDAKGHRVRAAIDGEPVALETPLEFRVEPQALRLLVPHG